MNAIQNFVFEENLVRVVERAGDTWFVGTDVCKALEIKNAPHALARLDDDEREADIAISDTSGTKYATIVSEAGVYRLVFTSRKEQAERFKRWLAHEVLPSIRRTGQFGASVPAAPMPDTLAERERRALALVSEARLIYGREHAARIWEKLGLPTPDALPPDTEAFACLAHLLDWRDGKDTIRDLINGAFRKKEGATIRLRAMGITMRGDGFVVANVHVRIGEIYAGTRWPRPFELLRRVPGAKPFDPHGGGRATDGTYLPSTVLG